MHFDDDTNNNIIGMRFRLITHSYMCRLGPGTTLVALQAEHFVWAPRLRAAPNLICKYIWRLTIHWKLQKVGIQETGPKENDVNSSNNL